MSEVVISASLLGNIKVGPVPPQFNNYRHGRTPPSTTHKTETSSSSPSLAAKRKQTSALEQSHTDKKQKLESVQFL